MDYLHGQKTGFFLDQKYNRRAAAALAPGRKVLDCFTHTGAFALNCAQAGAAQVTAVDISQEAVALTQRNAALNGLEGKVGGPPDVFDLLTQLAQAGGHPYDYIILGPPRLHQERGHGEERLPGVQGDQLQGHEALPRGGYPGHLLLLPLYDPRPLLPDAPGGRRRCGGVPSGRSPTGGRRRTTHPLGVPETEVPEVLSLPGDITRDSAVGANLEVPFGTIAGREPATWTRPARQGTGYCVPFGWSGGCYEASGRKRLP